MAHRFCVDRLPHVGEIVELPPEEAKHAAGVLRLRAGDEAVLFDGIGHAAAACFVEVGGGRAIARVIADVDPAEPRLRVTLYQGLCKGDKMDWIIQKCTELGVHDIQPVLFKRCDARMPDDAAAKAVRGQRIAREAAKQCGRAWVPVVRAAVRFDEFINMIKHKDNCSVFALWEGNCPPFVNMINGVTAARAGLVIGPEGGIEPFEIEAMEAAGARTASLGRRVLRTETAGMAALAIAMSASGDMS